MVIPSNLMVSTVKWALFKQKPLALPRQVIQRTMLTKKQKQLIMKKFATHKDDTGSPQVQIAILSAEVKELTGHLKQHKKDFSSRLGLLKKVGQRRRLMRYFKKEDHKGYEKLIKVLKLKDNV